MTANDSTRAALEASEAALAGLFRTSQIEAPTYFKGLVALAADWLFVGEPDRSQAILRRVSESYVREDLAVDMAVDPAYRQLVTALCEQLVRDGWVLLNHDQYDLPAAPAKA